MPKFLRIPLSLIVPHPQNANKLTGRARDVVFNNIKETGLYPPLIVRSLEASVEFRDMCDAGQFQLLDGEHRKGILEELGHADAEAMVWPGVTDVMAQRMLLTLNQGGVDDATKRARLIEQVVSGVDLDEITKFLPETRADIEKYLEIGQKAAAEGGGASKQVSFTARTGGEGRPTTRAVRLEIFCRDEDQERRIRAGIDRWLDEHDPDRKLEWRQAEALESLVEERS